MNNEVVALTIVMLITTPILLVGAVFMARRLPTYGEIDDESQWRRRLRNILIWYVLGFEAVIVAIFLVDSAR